jgi:hypothetical protein
VPTGPSRAGTTDMKKLLVTTFLVSALAFATYAVRRSDADPVADNFTVRVIRGLPGLVAGDAGDPNFEYVKIVNIGKDPLVISDISINTCNKEDIGLLDRTILTMAEAVAQAMTQAMTKKVVDHIPGLYLLRAGAHMNNPLPVTLAMGQSYLVAPLGKCDAQDVVQVEVVTNHGSGTYSHTKKDN